MRILIAFTAIFALLLLTAPAVAQAVDAGPEVEMTDVDEAAAVVKTDPVGYGKKVYDAFKSGEYWYLSGLVLCLMTVGFRYLMRKKWIGWFSTNKGGVVAAALMAVLAAVAVSLAGREPPSLELLEGALAALIAAIGQYTMAKKVILDEEASPRPDWL